MLVRLLGPVDVVVNGEPRPLHGLRRKAVLAALALRHGEVVSVDWLTEVVWGASAPSTSRNTLQSHVSYLRGVLGTKNAILAQPPGYLLDRGYRTDVLHAERLLRQARQSADRRQIVEDLTSALGLWRGQPLADVTGQPWLDEQAERLDVLRVEITRALYEARMSVGEHRELIPELEQLAAGHRLDEQIQAQLMLALYRSGRQADALAVYQRTRHALAEDLGVDPSGALRDLEVAILRQDPAIDRLANSGGFSRKAARPPVPAQLPPAPAFVGRQAELASLDAQIPDAAGGSAGAPESPPIAVLSGTPGVGKTALAVYWARHASARFPDGQLFINLRGFDSGGTALEPSDALRRFIEAFGVSEPRIPADLEAQAGLYRSMLARKRVLVVLDNARDAKQVRPLLPGSPGCMALVTSRNPLAGLVATEGATSLTLDLLAASDARELLTRRLGSARIAREADAVEDIIARCARLPLALTVAAARAATAPHFPLAAVASELRSGSRALDPFQAGDTASDVRSVFSWSYRALTPDAARLFRLIGLHRAPDFSLLAAASVAAIEPDTARALLAELTRAHLTSELAPDRYAFHDLLHAYANELAQSEDISEVREVAVQRLLDHYLRSAHSAVRLLEPHFEPLTLVPSARGVVAAEPATAEAAMSWFMAEHAGILAAVRLAADAGLATHAWQLAWTASTYFFRRGSWEDNRLAQDAALAAARHGADVSGEAHAILGLALGCVRSGRFSDAVPEFERALVLFASIADQVSQGLIHNSLTWIAEHQDRLEDALGHAAQALEFYRSAGHPGQATFLNDVGFCHARLGNFSEALPFCEQGLAAVRELGERNWEAAALDSLGYIHDGLGDHHLAIACYEDSIGIYHELGDRFNEADTLVSIGNSHLRAGDSGLARQAWSDALRIFEEIGHPDGDDVREKLIALNPRVVPPAGGTTRAD
jgi:DNA-binding SARP family transcriptional activator